MSYQLPVTALLLLSSAGLFAQDSPGSNGLSSRPGSGFSDSRHFLWFNGHWDMAKKNTFVIEGAGDSTATGIPASGMTTGIPAGSTANGKGGTVVVDPDGSIHLQTGGTEAWNKWVDKALQSEDGFIQDLNNPQDNLDPATHHLYQLLLPDAEERKQQLNEYKIDPQQDILSRQKPTGSKPAASKPARTFNDVIGDYCKGAKNDYDMVMSYYRNHVKGHQNDLNVLPPPAFEYNCYACDSNLRKSYDTTIEHYVRDFLQPEDSILGKGFRILHNLSQAGIDREAGIDVNIYDALFNVDKKAPSKSGACSYIELNDLYTAVYQTGYHLYLRALKLVASNRKNFKAAKPIIRTFLTIAHEWILISGDETAFGSEEPDLEDLVDQNIRFYDQAFRQKDWRTIGNIPYIIGLYGDKEVLGGNGQDLQEYLDQLLKTMNAFKLSIEMDIKIGKDNGYRIAHLKGDCHITPYFQHDSNQCYKWVVADEDQQDKLGFYKPRSVQTIDCQLLDNEIVSPPNAPKIVYTGTRKYTALLESLGMDFCNPGHDTIVLAGFTPNPSASGLWQFPYGPPQNLGVNGMEVYFQDVAAKKKLAGDGEARKEAGDMKEQGEQLKKQMEALKQQMAGGQGGVSYEKIQELMNKARSIGTTAVAAKLLYVNFLLPVQNNNAVLVDKKFNAKEINSDESQVIVYGYYTVHIENEGNGKLKPTKK